MGADESTRFRRWWRVRVVALVSLVLGVVPATAAAQNGASAVTNGEARAATTGQQGEADESCEQVPGDDWCEEWVAIYEGHTRTSPSHSVLSPSGDQLFVVGQDYGGNKDRMVVGAFDVATGEPVWVAEHPIGEPYWGTGGIAVSPDGRRVFVMETQAHDGWQTSREMVTIAYNAAPPEEPGDPELGEQLWMATFGPAEGAKQPGLVVTPDGETVLVAGTATEPGTEPGESVATFPKRNLVTIAYDAATGEEIWLSRHTDPQDTESLGYAIAISPDGQSAYVTGVFQPKLHAAQRLGVPETVTIAYAVSGEDKGEERWLARSQATSGNVSSWGAWLIDVSEDGERVFVTGLGNFLFAYGSIGTWAYDAATGDELWTKQAPGGLGINAAQSMAVNPKNDLVFVTGDVVNSRDDYDIIVLAYDQATGDLRWSQTYTGSAGSDTRQWRDLPSSVVTSPDGSLVYVTGTTGVIGWPFDAITLAYDSGSGDRVAIARYNDTGFDKNSGFDLLPRPDGSGVYVVGSINPGNRPDLYLWGALSYPTPGRHQ